MERFNSYSKQSKLILAISLVALTCAPITALDASLLCTADNFALIGGSTVTNTRPTTVYKDLGVWPGTSITGLANIKLMGAVHQTDAVAQQAQLEAFNDDTTSTDYGSSGISNAKISATPVPAAPWIFASGLFGVVGVVGVARTRRRSLVDE